MPGYKFDSNLIPSVLADARFQATGVYRASDADLHYCVIDPRRRLVNVWEKRLLGPLDSWLMRDSWAGSFFYTLTALIDHTEHFTNGPMMSPPRSSWMNLWMRKRWHVLPGLNAWSGKINWDPMSLVVHKGRIIDNGIGSPGGLGHFARVGQGRYRHYLIGRDPMPAAGNGPGQVREGIQGLTLLVENGGVSTHPEALDLQLKTGVAAWAKVPLIPAIETLDWPTEVGIHYPEEDEPFKASELDGVLVSAASNSPTRNATIATDLVGIKAESAVATDPSDSVICGARYVLNIECGKFKDGIQKYGLAVS